MWKDINITYADDKKCYLTVGEKIEHFPKMAHYQGSHKRKMLAVHKDDCWTSMNDGR